MEDAKPRQAATITERASDLASETIVSGQQTYFLDLRRSSAGSLYFAVTQSTRRQEGGYEQSRVVVFERSLRELSAALRRLCDLIESEAPEDQSQQFRQAVRKTSPRAFERWSEDEEATLGKGYQGGLSPEELAASLGRTTRAVVLRLQKMELLTSSEADELLAP